MTLMDWIIYTPLTALAIYLVARLITAAYFVSKRQFHNGDKPNGKQQEQK